MTTALIMIPIIDALARNVQTSKQVAFSLYLNNDVLLIKFLSSRKTRKGVSYGHPFGRSRGRYSHSNRYVDHFLKIVVLIQIPGTPPNLVVIRLLHVTFPLSSEISFLVWMAYSIPLGIIFGVFCFLYLNWHYFGMCRRVKEEELAEDDGYMRFEDEENEELIGDVKVYFIL